MEGGLTKDKEISCSDKKGWDSELGWGQLCVMCQGWYPPGHIPGCEDSYPCQGVSSLALSVDTREIVLNLDHGKCVAWKAAEGPTAH